MLKTSWSRAQNGRKTVSFWGSQNWDPQGRTWIRCLGTPLWGVPKTEDYSHHPRSSTGRVPCHETMRPANKNQQKSNQKRSKSVSLNFATSPMIKNKSLEFASLLSTFFATCQALTRDHDDHVHRRPGGSTASAAFDAEKNETKRHLQVVPRGPNPILLAAKNVPQKNVCWKIYQKNESTSMWLKPSCLRIFIFHSDTCLWIDQGKHTQDAAKRDTCHFSFFWVL